MSVTLYPIDARVLDQDFRMVDLWVCRSKQHKASYIEIIMNEIVTRNKPTTIITTHLPRNHPTLNPFIQGHWMKLKESFGGV